MRILLIGDIIGRPGRDVLRKHLPSIKRAESVDLVVANVENAAAGFGLTESVGQEILRAGVDIMTGGNHLWDKRGTETYIDSEPFLARPANYPAGTPGQRFVQHDVGDTRVTVLSLQGRVFMPPMDCPFRCLDELIEKLSKETDVFILDFHAEATSEKQAMGRYADGRVSVVVGTHTHVPTADERILPKGTGFVTDLGMTGPYDSIIGMREDAVMRRFLTSLPSRFEVASGDTRLSGLMVDVDTSSGRALSVKRVHVFDEDKVQ